MFKYLLTIIFLYISTAAQAGGFASGYLQWQHDQQVDNCIKACGQDGYCQANCIAAGKSQSQPQAIPPIDNPPRPQSTSNAPFCVVNANGSISQCFYYNADNCRQAAASIGGMCIANQNR